MSGFKIEVVPNTPHKGFSVEVLEKARKMPGELVTLINNLIRDEMQAMTTYMQQASVVAAWGYVALAQHFWETASEEMVHAMELMDRLNLFDEIPKVPQIPQIKVFGDVKGMIDHQVFLETDALAKYNQAVKVAERLNDHATGMRFRELIGDEERHYDWLVEQLDRIKREGLQDYLATMSKVPEVKIDYPDWQNQGAGTPAGG